MDPELPETLKLMKRGQPTVKVLYSTL